MFKNTFQSGFLSILYSIGSKPLQIWDKKVSILLSSSRSLSTLILISYSFCLINIVAKIGEERPHQAHHRQWHPVARPRNRWHQRQHHLHHVPCRPEEDARHQAAIFSDDHQKSKEILHVRSPSTRRQERAKTIPSEQLPEHDSSQALHLYDADETRRRMESDPVQLVWLYKTCLRNQLHWDTQSSSELTLFSAKYLFIA